MFLLRNLFQLLNDYTAKFSALNENYNNKSYQSHLSRWADRLLHFEFEDIHVDGVSLGIVDYMSRYPTFTAPKPSQYVELLLLGLSRLLMKLKILSIPLAYQSGGQINVLIVKRASRL